MLTPKNLRQRLRRLADLLADEAERNTEFGSMLADLLGVQSAQDKPKKSEKFRVPDPFDAFRARGHDGFREWLDALSVQELRAIVRQQRFDPSRLSDKWKTKRRFTQLIMDRVESRSKQGDVFRFYGKDTGEDENETSDENVSG